VHRRFLPPLCRDLSVLVCIFPFAPFSYRIDHPDLRPSSPPSPLILSFSASGSLFFFSPGLFLVAWKNVALPAAPFLGLFAIRPGPRAGSSWNQRSRCLRLPAFFFFRLFDLGPFDLTLGIELGFFQTRPPLLLCIWGFSANRGWRDWSCFPPFLSLLRKYLFPSRALSRSPLFLNLFYAGPLFNGDFTPVFFPICGFA